MRLVLDHNDFRRLSPETRKELIEVLAGNQVVDLKSAAKKTSSGWERPIDLTPELTSKLMHGLAENHRRRLELFAHKQGRVSMRDVLAITKDEDVRVLSYFQGAVTRKLRRILDDPDKKVYLLGWDYDSTKWDKSHTTIEDGMLYVTGPTVNSLHNYFAAS